MSDIFIANFDYSRGNANPIESISITPQQALNAPSDEYFYIVMFNHNQKVFYVIRSGRVKHHLQQWRRVFNKDSEARIADSVKYSMTEACVNKLCIAVTKVTQDTLGALKKLTDSGEWSEISANNVQGRMKSKPVNLYKVVDDTTGFSRYTLSADTGLTDIMTNVRNTTVSLSLGKKFKGIEGFDVICGEISRIASTKLYRKVKTTQIYHIRDKSLINVDERDVYNQVIRLNQQAFSDWLESPYVKALISKEGNLKHVG